MKKTLIAGLLALSPLLLACEIGPPAELGSPETAGTLEGADPVAEPVPASPDPAAEATERRPASPESATGGTAAAGEGDVPAAETDTCLEWTATGPRLSPCLILQEFINPLGHDDPDPWRPVSRSAILNL